ncbi:MULTISPECIES: nitrogen fixation protein NifQ [unclassified Brenneria]|uniref:nitrogen fixation protein NifQ n=2 Tax=unclassified Brenneria TaxID=2634434 RepID=UPI0029C4E84D|nr:MULTISPECIES: nitrogen fixation protein NifQ [unclassified Brenneria]MDX5626921.1 nitrogen fixation protein NifQ [Brenneria sp. L3-3Z]MDX5693729.1 nitrogen fixation protein NifQ [Brenneria sp. L4-2C]
MALMQTPDGWLRYLVDNHLRGRSRFPTQMNLDDVAWQALLQRVGLTETPRPPRWRQRDELLSGLLAPRRQECEQLADWLEQYMAQPAAPMHRLIAGASMGFNHLWQDLGLASRSELRQLMSVCFAPLVDMNANNMRWKKFFYRQICLAQDGELICRSPSCESCSEISLCFSPE